MLVALCGCGRLGFDAAATDGTPGDSAPGDGAPRDAPADGALACDGVTYRAPSHDFSGHGLDAYETFANSGTSFAEEDGVLKMRLPVNNSGAYTGVYVIERSAFLEVAATIELVQAPSSALGAQTGFYIGSMAGHVGLRFDSGTMDVIPSGPTPDYDPIAHRWLRIREAGGVVSFEVRSTAGPWVTLHTLPTPAWMSEPTGIELEAGTFMNVANPGEAHYDNLNLPPCP